MIRILALLLSSLGLFGQVVVLLGPPGSGKGTQSRLITGAFHIPGISTGELLRAEVRTGSPLGQRIQAAVATGELVSDEVVNGLVADRIARPDAAGGFILDGYPRTVAQAAFLDELLAGKKLPKPVVLYLDVPEPVLIERLSARGRADDRPDVIRNRLRLYQKETRPLLDFYKDHHRIDGSGTEREVFRGIRSALSR